MIDFRICDGNNELFLLLAAVRVRVGLPCQLQAGNISKTNFIGLELGVPHLLHCDFLYQPAAADHANPVTGFFDFIKDVGRQKEGFPSFLFHSFL